MIFLKCLDLTIQNRILFYEKDSERYNNMDELRKYKLVFAIIYIIFGIHRISLTDMVCLNEIMNSKNFHV